jgi:predicted  nucleic acid-binding Zn-ribbon protein
VSQATIERRLRQATARLRAARKELAVLDQQLASLAEDADDLQVRSLVGESPLADREHRDAQRSVDAMNRSRAATVAEIAKLERTIDELLERFVPDPS